MIRRTISAESGLFHYGVIREMLDAMARARTMNKFRKFREPEVRRQIANNANENE